MQCAWLVETAACHHARHYCSRISSPQLACVCPVIHSNGGGALPVRLARPFTPAVQPMPIHCLSTHCAHSAAHAHPLPQHSARRLPPTDPCTFYTFAPRAWRCTHTQRTVRAQHMSCVRGSAQHMRSTCVPVLAHRRGGVPGGAVPQAAPAPPAPGRPESGRLRRSVSPLLGASGSGSGSGTGVLSPMQRRAQPPPPPRGASSLPPSRPASSAVGGGDQLYDPFAHAHDALDEFKRPRR